MPATDVEDWEVLDFLTALVDKSLAVYEEAGYESRYRLLETVRQYAVERLADAGEAEKIRERAAFWFLGLAEEGGGAVAGGRSRRSWLGRLEKNTITWQASCGTNELLLNLRSKRAGNGGGIWSASCRGAVAVLVGAGLLCPRGVNGWSGLWKATAERGREPGASTARAKGS